MPRPKSPHDKVRLHVEMSVPVREMLEALQNRLLADSIAEVIRTNTISITNLLALLDEGYEITATKDGVQKSLKLLLVPRNKK